MGFDIHPFVERRDEAGRWRKVGNVFVRTREEPVNWQEWNERQEGRLEWREVIEVGQDQPWTDRDYDLFTILGLPLRPHIVPIAPLRGLPIDVSEEVRERLDDPGDFFVGHSWLTLAELQGYEGSARYPARFVRETLPQLRRLGPPDDVRVIVVLDTLGAHQSARVPAAVAARGAQLWFLPAYSPDLAPIEAASSKLKALSRRAEARTRAALDAALAELLGRITPQDARG